MRQAVCLLCLFACRPPYVPPPFETEQATTIGSEGGIVEREGVSLVIPAGALSRPVDISISPITIAGKSGYRFEPDGTQFAMPIEVSVPLTFETPELVHISSVTGYEQLDTRIDRERGVASAFIDSFSSVVSVSCCVEPPVSGFALRVVEQTTSMIHVEIVAPVDGVRAGLVLQTADGLGNTSYTGEIDVSRFPSSRVAGRAVYDVYDYPGAPGFGRMYRLHSMVRRNGAVLLSPPIEQVGGFTTPSDRFVLEGNVVGSGELDIEIGPAVRVCTSACEEEIADGTVVSFTARAGVGYVFDAFSGDCVANAVAHTATVLMDRHRTCTAVFTPTAGTSEGSFFVTAGTGLPGVDFSGLPGLDAYCQAQASASSLLSATAKAKTWIAFMGSSNGGLTTAVERVGAGPWTNVRGEAVLLSELRAGTLPSAKILTQHGARLAPSDDEVATGYGQYDGGEPLTVEEAEDYFVSRADSFAESFGHDHAFCLDMTEANPFASLRVGHAEWQSAHAGDDPSIQRTATSSFNRHCSMTSPSAYDTLNMYVGAALVPSSHALHLYCFSAGSR